MQPSSRSAEIIASFFANNSDETLIHHVKIFEEDESGLKARFLILSGLCALCSPERLLRLIGPIRQLPSSLWADIFSIRQNGTRTARSPRGKRGGSNLFGRWK